MGAADYAGDGWGGGLLVQESVVQRTASFGDGAGGASDDVALGAAQSGVAAAGEAGDGVDGTQPAGIAAKAGPDQPNHLKRNATPHPRHRQRNAGKGALRRKLAPVPCGRAASAPAPRGNCSSSSLCRHCHSVGDSDRPALLGKGDATPHSNAIYINDDAVNRTNRAISYIDNAQCEPAIRDAQAALAKEPSTGEGYSTDVEANFALAWCYYEQGKYLQALQHADAAIAISENHQYLASEIAVTTELREAIRHELNR